VARDLLSEDGVIFVQCDDNEQAYLKVLMDEIFGRDNFINIISAKMKNIAGASGGGEDKRLKKNIEFLNIFSKDYKITPSSLNKSHATSRRFFIKVSQVA
jgi:adenine-specific DNA-methyltransferase